MFILIFLTMDTSKDISKVETSVLLHYFLVIRTYEMQKAVGQWGHLLTLECLWITFSHLL